MSYSLKFTVTHRIILGRFPGFGRGVSSRTLSGLKSLIGKYAYVRTHHRNPVRKKIVIAVIARLQNFIFRRRKWPPRSTKIDLICRFMKRIFEKSIFNFDCNGMNWLLTYSSSTSSQLIIFIYYYP